VKLKLRNKLTHKRLTTVGALIFVEAFFTPLNTILQQGIWPTPVQLAGCLTTAILQVTTITLGLIEKA